MKKLFTFPLLLLISLSSHLVAEVSVNGFEIEKGINISHTLSQIPIDQPHPAPEDYFTEKDVIFIKYVGLDHIRMPIDEIEMWDDSGIKIQKAWDYLHRVIGWCEKHELRIIVDLHTVRSHHFNAANEGGLAPNTLWTDDDAQETFLNLWRQISDELKPYSNQLLAYEILNEAVAPEDEDWNKLIGKTMKVIRAAEANRVVVIGSNLYQSYERLPNLRVPENDPNIIVSFHYYDPFIVTHYKTSWNFMREYSGPLTYPGIPIQESELEKGNYSDEFLERTKEQIKHWDINVIEAAIVKATEYAKSKGLPIYCGEWGCFIDAPRDIRVKLYEDTVAVFEKHNIARANWDYQGSFRIFDKDNLNIIDWEILNALTGAE